MKKGFQNQNCYICNNEAVSREHVPARCFFPDQATYRINLITVPSCKEHNEDTSEDDKYVRNLISMSIGNNAVAFKQFIEKTIKSLIERSKSRKEILGRREKVLINDKELHRFPIDRERFERVMKKIAYALFYHEYKIQWNRILIVMTKNLVSENNELDPYGLIIKVFEKFLPPEKFDGHNPSVFQYKLDKANSENPRDVILRMLFYEGFEVWISPVDDSDKYDLS